MKTKRSTQKKHKYIFVIGGVMSGVGKGVSTASLGTILKAKGYKINLMKVDPYLNVDAGTMNPTEHGEVFVLDSGLETDQDMGNYERFLNQDIDAVNYCTSGMVYQEVIQRERNLGYRGKCVEAIPHVRDEIMSRYIESGKQAGSDITIVEIGGTIGDYQNALFMEAARVLKVHHPDDVLFVLVSFLPIPSKLGEMKTRPTQNAVRQLNSYGIQADMLIARSEIPLDKKRKEKLAITCNVHPNHVISAPDISSIYDVPENFLRDKIDVYVTKMLKLPNRQADLSRWKAFAKKAQKDMPIKNIAVIGKYFATGDFVLSDSYLSVIEAVKHAAYAEGVTPKLHWLSSQDFEKNSKKLKDLKKYDGIVVPGGFGETGIEGKIAVIKFARENKIPYFGLCYGMQLMTIEFARNVAGLKGAHTVEINPEAKHPVIDILPDQKRKLAEKDYGGTMRLGAYDCYLKKGTIARKAYGKDVVSERHRHRYEVNPEYIERLLDAGIVFSGTSQDGILTEIAELPKSVHPFMLATQFHPEFKSRPLSPHPLFVEFLKACKKSGGKK